VRPRRFVVVFDVRDVVGTMLLRPLIVPLRCESCRALPTDGRYCFHGSIPFWWIDPAVQGRSAMARTAMNLIDPVMRRCIDECVRCHEVCLSTVPYCLEQGGRHSAESHITLLLDCADACQAAADFMLRGSPLHTRSCSMCAEVCRRCADECAGFEADEVMRACAQACERCAESCEQMAAAAV
jgi:hypothetical protein